MSIAENLARLHDRVAAACARVNRPTAGVALMAVSKMHSVEAILEAYAAGQRLFGENRVEQFAAKSPAVASLPWTQYHLIGPLQSNKTGKAAELFDAIDTVDSLKIAQRLNSASAELNKKLPILIEVKLSSEESNHGLAPEDLPALLHQIAPSRKPHSPWPDDCTALDRPRATRACAPIFSAPPPSARRAATLLYPTLTQLSIGMSNDFIVADPRGQHRRSHRGTAIFGKRIYA